MLSNSVEPSLNRGGRAGEGAVKARIFAVPDNVNMVDIIFLPV